MTATERTALWISLSEEGLVAGECPKAGADPSPWYVRAMVGVAGWIAAAFLLGFLGLALTFIAESGPAAIAVGLLLCAAAIAMLSMFPRQEFIAQFALAVSLAGQALVMTGLFRMFPGGGAGVFVAIAGFEAALAVIARYSVHRTWSAFAAALALFLALQTWHASALFPSLGALAFVVLQAAEARFVTLASLFRAASAGVALALLAMVPAASLFDVQWLTGRSAAGTASAWATSGAVLMGLVFIGAAVMLLRQGGVALSSRVGAASIAGAVALAVATWPVPGVTAGALVTLCAFAAGRVAVAALGLVIAAAALSYYYYSFEASLMTKALSLLAAGGVLIVVRYALRSWIGLKASEALHA
jgi:hypothetical protein